jgi:hypothetical protein
MIYENSVSSRKKAECMLYESLMLKKLIKELKFLPNSVENNSKLQSEASGSFTDLYEAIIQAERRIVTNN